MKKSNEPFWWALFSAGGVVTAILTPIFILMTGVGPSLGLAEETLDYATMRALASHGLTKLVLLTFISLSLLHWAHRFRFTLLDLGVHGARALIAVLCYGAAIVGTIFAVVVLAKL